MGCAIRAGHAGVEQIAHRRHYEGHRPDPLGMGLARSKSENLFGLPVSGDGADISLQYGRRHFARAGRDCGAVLDSGDRAAVPTRQTKAEVRSCMPLSGRGADISLLGGRRQFPDQARSLSPDGARSQSPGEVRNETVADVSLRGSRQLIGRLPAGPARTPRSAFRPVRRCRSSDRIPAVQGNAGAAMEEKDSASTAAPSSPAGGSSPALSSLASMTPVGSPSASGSRFGVVPVEAATPRFIYSADGQCHVVYVRPSQPPPTEVRVSPAAVLSQSLEAVKLLQGVAAAVPGGAGMNEDVTDSVRCNLDRAWAAACEKFNLPATPQSAAPRRRAPTGPSAMAARAAARSARGR